MDSSEISPEYELTVRNHIRQTFLPYARKYIIKDHVAYTESKLEQIFTESLDFISIADPRALVLPPDPFDILAKSLDSLEPFEERWTTDSDTVHKLKTTLKAIVGGDRELCSDTCWQENDHTYIRLAEIYRPMTPILSNRARQQTPKPGSSALRASLPRIQLALFEHIGIKPVAAEQVMEFDAPIEEVLNLRPTMDAATRGYVLSRFKLANLPAQSTETNVHVTSFLRADSPLHQVPRQFSPPLFARSKVNSGSFRTGMGNARDIVDRVGDVPAPVPEELEDDMDRVNMTIVDGWATLPISSPPSASPLSSQDTEIDELWGDSPTAPGSPATSLFNARMDDVEIPRIHKPGHALPSTLGPRRLENLTSIMEHLKPVASTKAKEVDCTIPVKQKHKHALFLSFANAEDEKSFNADDSMLGQPPSVCAGSFLTTNAKRDKRDCGPGSEDFEMDMERGLNMALRQVYHEVQEENIEGCVLEERLDEKDVALMDVPHLPPPSVHRGTSLQPSSMRTLLCGTAGKLSVNAELPRHTMLQIVKGIKPLNLELSWRPFKFSYPIPTDESVTLVEGPALVYLEKEGYTDKASEAKIRGLLEDLETVSYHSVTVTGSKNYDDRRGTGAFGLTPSRLNKPSPEYGGFELVLTKRERRLLAGLSEFEDLQEYRVGDGEDRQEQQNEASLVTEGQCHPVNENSRLLDENDQSVVQPANLCDNRHLCSDFGDSNLPHLSPRGDEQRLTCGDVPPGPVFYKCGVLDVVPGVSDHSDRLVHDISGAAFQGQRVVFNDSGVELLILHDNGPSYRDQVAGYPRYLEANRPPEDIDDSEEDKFHYICDQLQDGEQELFPSLPLSTHNQHGASAFPTRLRTLRGHGQDPNSFFSLSFCSQSGQASRDPIEPDVASPDGDVERIHILPPDNGGWPCKIQGISENGTPENVSSFLQYFVPEVDPSTAPASKRKRLDDPRTTTIVIRGFLDDHLALRNRPVTHDPPPPVIPTAITSRPQSSNASPPRGAPPEILDVHTIRLPDAWDPPTTNHYYLASMALIQKRALLRALRAPECQVHLVERYALGGVDMIMDPDTAVLFAPLLALPCEVEGLTDRISQASWRYTHILVILEAFPSADALTADDRNRDSTNSTKLTPYAFSPPILKAVKKLRRLLGIADGFGTKNATCEIHWAFPNDVAEAALFVRILGDLADEWALREGRHVLWGDRGWLQVDEHEDEADLAAVECMNPFASFVILYQRSLQEVLDMPPERRVAEFSDLVGSQRIASLNGVIEQRTHQMDVDSATESDVGYSMMGVH